MDRPEFLRRGLATLGLLAGLDRLAPIADAAPVVEPVAPSVANFGQLTATGGLCAPVTPYYRLVHCDLNGKLIKDAFPAFKADRGGITFTRPPEL